MALKKIFSNINNKYKQWEIYLKKTYHKGYKNSFKEGNIKDKSLLLVNAIPYRFFSVNYRNKLREPIFEAFRKNKIKDEKFFWLKFILYIPFLFSNIAIKSLFIWSILMGSLIYVSDSTESKLIKSAFNHSFFDEDVKKTEQPFHFDILHYEKKYIKENHFTSLINEKYKISFDNFYDIYENKIDESIKENKDILSFYHKSENGLNSYVIIDNDFEAIQYKVNIEGNKVYNFIKENQKNINHIYEDNKETKFIKKDEEIGSIIFGELRYHYYSFGYFDFFNYENKQLHSSSYKAFGIEENNTYISYYNNKLKFSEGHIQKGYEAAAKEYQELKNGSIAYIINALFFMFLLFIIDHLFLRKKIFKIANENYNKKIIKYNKMIIGYNTDLLLEDKRTEEEKRGIKATKQFKPLKI